MPFARKFRAMMDFPFPGDTVGCFTVESVDVSHHSGSAGIYGYNVRLVLQGPGGQQGVRRALKALLSSHPTTFSGYGNPYQLWFRKPSYESLGDKRYEVRVKGAGERIYLEPELERFLAYLEADGHLADADSTAGHEALVDAYLEGYKTEILRKVGRYRSKLYREERRR